MVALNTRYTSTGNKPRQRHGHRYRGTVHLVLGIAIGWSFSTIFNAANQYISVQNDANNYYDLVLGSQEKEDKNKKKDTTGTSTSTSTNNGTNNSTTTSTTNDGNNNTVTSIFPNDNENNEKTDTENDQINMNIFNLHRRNKGRPSTMQDVCTFPFAERPSESSADQLSSFTLADASTNKIFYHYISDILKHSQHQDDKDYTWHEWTSKLLQYITPRLKNSVKNLPILHWEKVGNILNIAFERYKYIQSEGDNNANDNVTPPRQVRVLILGGSVTLGVNCAKYPKGRAGSKPSAHPRCAWPGRLDRMLTELLGGKKRKSSIFHVQSFAAGGTNSNIGKNLLDYNLLNEENLPYDVIINAYSTNDMHLISVKEAKENNMTLEQSLLSVNQDFIRAALRDTSRCEGRHLPLVLYYNDYVGNEQNDIMTINSYSNVISTLASYYGIGQISFADVVKHTVWGDPAETWFSPDQWPERNVHPGRSFHIVTPWLFLYNFLEMATTYCDMKHVNALSSFDNVTSRMNITDNQHDTSSLWTGYQYVEGLPRLEPQKQANAPAIPPAPRPLPFGLPPPLDYNLTLLNIREKWKYNEKSAIKAEMSTCPDGGKSISSCAFSFMAGFPGTINARQLQRVLDKNITSNDGWELVSDHHKLGFAAKKEQASFEMEFDTGLSEVKVLTFFYMKSYGEEWEGSELRVKAFVVSNNMSSLTSEVNMLGYHDQHTSETYSDKVAIGTTEGAPPIMPGDRLRLQFDLIGGGTFKLIGVLLCDH